MVRELISYGADVNQVNDFGKTALYEAADSDNLEIVKELLIHGADGNYADHHGRTALYWSRHNNLEMVRELISYGAYVNNADDKSTALYWAAS